jgi:ribosomal protein L11 methyltransferase
MKWIELCLETQSDITEEISYALIELGATGTQIQNPDEIKSLIEKAGAKELADIRDFSQEMGKYAVRAYFAISSSIREIKGALNKKFPNADILWREIDDSEWTGNWKKYYKAFNITKRFRVIPSWEATGKTGRYEIIMDPGMAFGTGTHESTELCARLIDENISKGDKFLDIGTGTGILSIIASRCGALEVIAIDIDEAAVKSANENLSANRICNAEVYRGDLTQISTNFFKKNRAPFVFDMIAANIVSDVIIDISPMTRKILKKGGLLVCSGIITEREDDVLAQLDKVGFKIREIIRKNEWTAILAYA